MTKLYLFDSQMLDSRQVWESDNPEDPLSGECVISYTKHFLKKGEITEETDPILKQLLKLPWGSFRLPTPTDEAKRLFL